MYIIEIKYDVQLTKSKKKYGIVNDLIVQRLQSICGIDGVIVDKDKLQDYSHDETEDLHFLPEAVVLPKTTQQVSAVVKLCAEHQIPITPLGAQTGLSGGALCVYGGVGLSCKKMNAILQLDEDNLQITLQPGVITQVLQQAVIEKGLFYPPDPSSKGSCFIGGNIAENAGGPRAVKYGVTADYVLNLEVVLPSGEVIWTGANVLKNATGYNLTALLVGSEGTLGIITQAVLKLIPFPKKNIVMLAPFNSAKMACRAVAGIFKAGIVPSCLEFMERDAIDWVLEYVPDVRLEVGENVEAHLLIEVDGNHMDSMMEDAEKIHEVLMEYQCGEILFAEDEKQKELLWMIRRRVAEAVKSNSVYKEEDTVVPRYQLPELLEGIKQIGEKYGFKSICYGHAGDGNLHVNIIKGKLSEDFWQNMLPKAIEDIFHLTVGLGGTISGEHGIGWVQKDYMPIAFDGLQLELFQKIKTLFDPLGIMNPGKVIPD